MAAVWCEFVSRGASSLTEIVSESLAAPEAEKTDL